MLHYNDTSWCKKSRNFDVTMGSFDGAETCELVGLFLLNELKSIEIDVGLYRDDGIALVNKKTAKETEQIKRKIIQIFNKHGLQITTQPNIKCVDFLDITLDFET